MSGKSVLQIKKLLQDSVMFHTISPLIFFFLTDSVKKLSQQSYSIKLVHVIKILNAFKDIETRFSGTHLRTYWVQFRFSKEYLYFFNFLLVGNFHIACLL